jgi:CubicO group peptidase (beta-lactamase class C family)
VKIAGALLGFYLSGCLGMTTVHWQRGPTDCSSPAEEWHAATPAEAGIDGSRLEDVARDIERGELANVHSVLVARDGKLVFERYFAGDDHVWGRPLGRVEFGPENLHDLRSVSKSVVGALVGIAHGDGSMPDLDAPLARYFPEQAKGREDDLAGRTLRHALSMSAGLSWDELSHPYWDPRNDENGLWRASDPLEFALSRRPIAPGGARFAYNGGMPVLLAAVVERATHVPLDRFAVERLWCPLGVAEAEWVRHGSGVFVGASGLRLRPRDMARFGQMMLDEGRYAGRQIVPAEHVRASLQPQIDTGGSLTPRYGYQWWIGDLPMAIGNGGQRIAVDRERRLVIVVTAGNYDLSEQSAASTRIIQAVRAAVVRG